MGCSDEVAAKFVHTDFHRQKVALTTSLFTILAFARHRVPHEPELERIAQIHSRAGHDIRPEMYDLWLECLMQAVREHDPQFNPCTETAWRNVLARGIAYMKARY